MSAGQLRALGLSTSATAGRVRAGRLHVVRRGVYAVGHAALAPGARLLAAVLACGAGAVLSHRSAAHHLGLLQSASSTVDVTVRTGRASRPGIRVHRARHLTPDDIVMHEGIPCTSVARTLLDLAATVTRHQLERAIAQAMHLRVYDHAAVLDVLARNGGHRGNARLRRATRSEPKLTRSYLEARFLDLVRRAGLPAPLVNEPLEIPDHPQAIPDFHWPSLRLVVETDGGDAHGTRAAFVADRRRDAALAAAGIRVVRFSYDDVEYEPATVMRLLAALA